MFLGVSIPQAVSTVATYSMTMFEYTNKTLVSIPQAVSTVATAWGKELASGDKVVSIPQAVSTVATELGR